MHRPSRPTLVVVAVAILLIAGCSYLVWHRITNDTHRQIAYARSPDGTWAVEIHARRIFWWTDTCEVALIVYDGEGNPRNGHVIGGGGIDRAAADFGDLRVDNETARVADRVELKSHYFPDELAPP